MSRRKTAEQRLIEVIDELGLIKVESIVRSLTHFMSESQKPKKEPKPKLVKAETAG